MTATLQRWATVSACALLLTLSGSARILDRALAVAEPNDNRQPAGELSDGVLKIALVATRAIWHPDGDSLPGIEVTAFAEEGKAARVPGPLIRVPSGGEIRATVRNALTRDTIAFHVPTFVSPMATDSTVIAPGETREVRVKAARPGTFTYRATANTALSRGVGVHEMLVGAFVVDSATTATSANDRVFVLTELADSVDSDGIPLDDHAVFAINGRSWPHTERLSVTVGDTLRWRVVNSSALIHPMHLHGVYFQVHDFTGSQSAPRWVVTQRMSAFSTMLMTWAPERPGNWLFHCHLPIHVAPGAHRTVDSRAHENHTLRGMGGLMLGISARPRSGEPIRDVVTRRRQMRLIAVRDSGFPDTAPSLRFVLEEKGQRLEARPGLSPALNLERGEPVTIRVVNQMSEPTAVHWHGIELESYFDGVPGFGGSERRLTPIIAPRDSFDAHFTPPRAGTFMYHSHVDEVRQHRAGLVGALIVRDRAVDQDNEHVIFIKTARAGLNARPLLEINGKARPDTIVLPAGRPTRLRFINLSVSTPSALVTLTARTDSVAAGLTDSLVVSWRLLAKDGADIPERDRLTGPARQLIAMGETYDYEIAPPAPGSLRIEIRAGGRGGRLITRIPIRVN